MIYFHRHRDQTQLHPEQFNVPYLTIIHQCSLHSLVLSIANRCLPESPMQSWTACKRVFTCNNNHKIRNIRQDSFSKLCTTKHKPNAQNGLAHTNYSATPLKELQVIAFLGSSSINFASCTISKALMLSYELFQPLTLPITMIIEYKMQSRTVFHASHDT